MLKNKTQFWLILFAVMSVLALKPRLLLAQAAPDQLAATMEVLSSDVQVKRVDTVNWISVKKEAIVGVGDTIRTDANGHARITFFADGTETDILPNTEYRIDQFEGDADSFKISVNVLIGQTTQQLARLLNPSSSYNVETPGMVLGARGTEFAIRVEANGRAGLLVSKGNVAASKDQSNASVPPGFGVRAAANDALSDVVKASTFEELDAAIDGCPAAVSVQDDVRFNVRTGPSLAFPRVGTVAPSDVSAFVGVNTSGSWYRIAFRGGYGWINASTATISKDCPGLRQFANDYGPEDTSRYTSLGDAISPASLTEPAPDITPEATQTSGGS